MPSRMSDEEIAFYQALAELRYSPHWPKFFAYLRQLSAEADSQAVMNDARPDIFRGRARAFRELVTMLESSPLGDTYGKASQSRSRSR